MGGLGEKEGPHHEQRRPFFGLYRYFKRDICGHEDLFFFFFNPHRLLVEKTRNSPGPLIV